MKMKTVKLCVCSALAGLLAMSGFTRADTLPVTPAFAQAATPRSNPTRIVVLPFYTEDGVSVRQAADPQLREHLRRLQGFINNQLVRHGFEVINPFAHEWTQAEYDKLAERFPRDSVLAAKDLNRRYATDAVYLVSLKVNHIESIIGDNGPLCQMQSRVEGEGYDSADRDLGARLEKTFIRSSRDCEDAIIAVEKEVADVVGRALTGWKGGASHVAQPSVVIGASVIPGASTTQPSGEGGVLQRHNDQLESLLTIRLDGATSSEWTEIFGKVLYTVPGITDVQIYESRLVPNNPQASHSLWRIRTAGTDDFKVQANIIQTIKNVIDAGGTITLNNVPYRYSAAEVDVLKGIQVGSRTSREMQFVIDREVTRDRDFTGQHDPYKTSPSQPVKKGDFVK